MASSVAEGAYLDYAATTPLDPRVAQAMAHFQGPEANFANPASPHPAGRSAAAAIANAQAQVLEAVGAEGYRLTWTSGATEADNLAIVGLARALAKRNRSRHRILVCATDHSAVLAAARATREYGFEVVSLGVEADGRLDFAALNAQLDESVALVSVSQVNNETGVIQDVAAISARVAECGALLHVDAAQSAGRIEFNARAMGVDLVSLSAHKFYGPNGIGALCHHPDVRLEPLIVGGGQQAGLRSGTLPVALIVGMGEAFRLTDDQAERARQRALQTQLCDQLGDLGAVVLNGRRDGSAHVLNVSFAGVHGAALQSALADFAVGFGSACSSAQGPSHVLRAMQRPDALAHAAVRLSLGRFTQPAHIDEAVGLIREVVNELRASSPVWREIKQGQSVADVYGVTTTLEFA